MSIRKMATAILLGTLLLVGMVVGSLRRGHVDPFVSLRPHISFDNTSYAAYGLVHPTLYESQRMVGIRDLNLLQVYRNLKNAVPATEHMVWGPLAVKVGRAPLTTWYEGHNSTDHVYVQDGKVGVDVIWNHSLSPWEMYFVRARNVGHNPFRVY